MNRSRDFLLISFIATLSLGLTPVYAAGDAAETITQAEQDMKSAAHSGAVGHLADKAIGAGAIGIDKLLKLAKKKLDEARTMKQGEWLRSCRGLHS